MQKIKAEALRYLGYKNQKIEPELEHLIDRLIAECRTAAAPKSVYKIFDVDISHGDIRLNGTTLIFTGSDIYNHLFQAKKCAVLAATLGAGVEFAILKYQSIAMTSAVILDAVGAALIEDTVDQCEADIISAAQSINMHTNYRYSPGYGNFPIEMQRGIINALHCEKRIGLTVTENSILIPRKSVTAVIGFFEQPQQSPKTGCTGCAMYKSCQFRKDGLTCDKP